MALTEFTSYDEVRSALGVSIDEIGDAELALPLYELGLKVDLKSISNALITSYTTAKATPPGQRTGEEEDLVSAVHLFATYSVARQLTTSLPLFSPKEIGDNKALMVRYSTDPYKEVIKRINERYDQYRTYVDTVYAAFATTTVTKTKRPYFAVATSTTNPITGT
jgi:hypothetical protein